MIPYFFQINYKAKCNGLEVSTEAGGKKKMNKLNNNRGFKWEANREKEVVIFVLLSIDSQRSVSP